MGAKERLTYILDRKGWNQSRLSRALGEPDRHWVNNRLLGKSAIKADEIPRLAAALDVPCSAFFEGEPLCPESRLPEQIPPEPDQPDLFDAYMESYSQDLPDEERQLITAVRALRRRYLHGLEGGR